MGSSSPLIDEGMHLEVDHGAVGQDNDLLDSFLVARRTIIGGIAFHQCVALSL